MKDIFNDVSLGQINSKQTHAHVSGREQFCGCDYLIAEV
jgi:hypothetical protein